jgi:hypothetical protein
MFNKLFLLLILIVLCACAPEAHRASKQSNNHDYSGWPPEDEIGGHPESEAPCPEPCTLLLVGAGSIGLYISRRRRKNVDS